MLHVGIRKTKHMFIVSLGVHSMSCLLRLFTIAPNYQLNFSGQAVSPHLEHKDMCIHRAGQRREQRSVNLTHSAQRRHTCFILCMFLCSRILFLFAFKPAFPMIKSLCNIYNRENVLMFAWAL